MPRAEQVRLTNEFLEQNYAFRKNLLSNRLEFREVGETDFTAFSELSLNSIINYAESELPDEVKSVKTRIERFINSSDIPVFDPIKDYLQHLPTWDGNDHLATLLKRVPKLGHKQLEWLKIWFRGAVVHWLGEKDELHGNECVPTFIGAQGCGKSTFMQRLLPPELRCFYLDHLHLANKYDKEMALTSNLIVNLDELDQYKASQQAELKQALSKVKVNGRPIYGRVQEERKRYASFVATTNNHRPLLDPTGTRRFIIVRVPDGDFIDNGGDIDYQQLYAQVKAEIEMGLPFYFSSYDVKDLQTNNLQFQHVTDLGKMIEHCYRHPEDEDLAANIKATPVKDIAEYLLSQFPNLDKDSSLHYHIGVCLRDLGYEKKKTNSGTSYLVVLRQ